MMKYVVDLEHKHLGGNRDKKSTYYPKLYSYIIKKYKPNNFIDIGCGRGRTSMFFLKNGINVYAVDGLKRNLESLENAKCNVFAHDYTLGKLNLNLNFDIGWCCEVLEHIEEKFLNNVFDTIKKCNVFMMTHALPGQEGWHHVNCQKSDYWIDKFEKKGFKLDEQETKITRDFSHSHYRKTGMVFARSN